MPIGTCLHFKSMLSLRDTCTSAGYLFEPLVALPHGSVQTAVKRKHTITGGAGTTAQGSPRSRVAGERAEHVVSAVHPQPRGKSSSLLTSYSWQGPQAAGPQAAGPQAAGDHS